MTDTDWLTLALVVITAYYAWAILNILRANEAMVSTMRDQQNAAMCPYILVSPSVKAGTQRLYLSIKNVGKTAAHDPKFSPDKNFYQFGERSKEICATRHKIEAVVSHAGMLPQSVAWTKCGGILDGVLSYRYSPEL